MNEFADEDFEEDFAEPEAEAPAQPQPVRGRPPKQQMRPQQQQQPIATKEGNIPKERFAPYMLPTRIGVFDNTEAKPLLEDQDIQNLMLTILVKILNDVEEIKQSM